MEGHTARSGEARSSLPSTPPDLTVVPVQGLAFVFVKITRVSVTGGPRQEEPVRPCPRGSWGWEGSSPLLGALPLGRQERGVAHEPLPALPESHVFTCGCRGGPWPSPCNAVDRVVLGALLEGSLGEDMVLPPG